MSAATSSVTVSIDSAGYELCGQGTRPASKLDTGTAAQTAAAAVMSRWPRSSQGAAGRTRVSTAAAASTTMMSATNPATNPVRMDSVVTAATSCRVSSATAAASGAGRVRVGAQPDPARLGTWIGPGVSASAATVAASSGSVTTSGRRVDADPR